MTREKVMNKLNDIFCDVFDNDSIIISELTTSSEIEGWDSVMHITLIAEIEDEFDVRFSMNDVLNMKTVGDIASRIMELKK